MVQKRKSISLRGLAAFIILIGSPVLFAQDNPGDSTESSRIMTLRIQSQTPELEAKLHVISQIEGIFNEGSQGDETEALVEILSDIAQEGVTSATYMGVFRKPDFPIARERAAAALGITGSDKAHRALLEVIKKDQYLGAIIAAVDSIGKLGPDDDGAVINIFSWVLMGIREVYQDEYLVRTTLYALYEMSEKDSSILENGDLMDGIIFASQGSRGYSRQTREIGIRLINKVD